MGYRLFAYFVEVVLKGDGTSFSMKSTSIKWCAASCMCNGRISVYLYERSIPRYIRKKKEKRKKKKEKRKPKTITKI